MKKNLFYLVFLGFSFLYCLSSNAMVDQFEQLEQTSSQGELPHAGDKREKIFIDLCDDDENQDKKKNKKRKIESPESSEEDLQGTEPASIRIKKIVVDLCDNDDDDAESSESSEENVQGIETASVRIKKIAHSLESNQTLSGQELDEVFSLTKCSPWPARKQGFFASTFNNAYGKKLVRSCKELLETLARSLEQLETAQDEIPHAEDLSNNDNDEKVESDEKIESSKSNDEEDVQGIEIAKIATLKCLICACRYSKTDALSKSISCCASYHLFCTDCVNSLKKSWLRQDFEKRPRCGPTPCPCPHPSCDKKISNCYTNDPSEENYLALKKLLESCTHADAAKKQVLNLLLLRKEGTSSDLQLPESDNNLEDIQDSCLLCKSEVADNEIFITSCECEKTCHQACLDILKQTKEICEDCGKEI